MFMIKADYDDELMKFGKRKTDTKEESDAAVKVVARYIGLEEKSIKLEFTNQHGYTYRVTMKVKNGLHNIHTRTLWYTELNRGCIKNVATDLYAKTFLCYFYHQNMTLYSGRQERI